MEHAGPKRPRSAPRRHKEELISVSPTTMGFPILNNQFNILVESQIPGFQEHRERRRTERSKTDQSSETTSYKEN